MARSKRLHKYYRVEVNGIKYWACALPDCNHHMPKHQEHFLKGKVTICWDCNEGNAKLDETNWNEEFPLCEPCRAVAISAGRIKADPVREAIPENKLKSFLKEMEEKAKKVS